MVRTFRVWLGTALALVFATAGIAGAVPATAKPAPPTPVIVELKPGTDPGVFTKKQGFTPTHKYTQVMNGFSAKLSAGQLAKVKSDPNVVAVTNDAVVATIEPPAGRDSLRPYRGKRTQPGVEPYEDVPQPAQYISSEIERVRATESVTADIDGIDDSRVDVDIAILDTGIDPHHPDLNVVGGYDCLSGSNGRGWGDTRDGHGSVVAGEAAAIDNGIGIVGVAPGARLHSVRVISLDDRITDSAFLCGLDWLIRNANRIEVANMSFSGDEAEHGRQWVAGPCKEEGAKHRRPDRIHDAICRVVGQGVTLTASAGNHAVDVHVPLTIPAGYDEVIAVSAMVDFDGKPGGLSAPPPSCFPEDVDDTFAVFSNYGQTIDVAAPGVCSISTFPGGLYAIVEGTSFSAPMVAGGAALLVAESPTMTPAQVRAKLIATAEPGPIPGDPDAYPEGILNVSTF